MKRNFWSFPYLYINDPWTERILAYYMVLEHERIFFWRILEVFSGNPWCLWPFHLCFRVRRSSTWSVQQMPTWLSLSAGAAPLTRMRCSLGTRWTSATSVLWSKDRHFSFLQVFPGPIWEGLRKGEDEGNLWHQNQPLPLMFWPECEIPLSYQLKTQNCTSGKIKW